MDPARPRCERRNSNLSQFYVINRVVAFRPRRNDDDKGDKDEGRFLALILANFVIVHKTS